jgi:hypothetical protein
MTENKEVEAALTGLIYPDFSKTKKSRDQSLAAAFLFSIVRV